MQLYVEEFWHKRIRPDHIRPGIFCGFAIRISCLSLLLPAQLCSTKWVKILFQEALQILYTVEYLENLLYEFWLACWLSSFMMLYFQWIEKRYGKEKYCKFCISHLQQILLDKDDILSLNKEL